MFIQYTGSNKNSARHRAKEIERPPNTVGSPDGRRTEMRVIPVELYRMSYNGCAEDDATVSRTVVLGRSSRN